MADAPIPSPTSRRPATRALRVWHMAHATPNSNNPAGGVSGRPAHRCRTRWPVGNSSARTAVASVQHDCRLPDCRPRVDVPAPLPASEGPSRGATVSNSGGCGEIQPAGKAVLRAPLTLALALLP